MSSISLLSTFDILFESYWLKMFRVDAGAIPTKMIENEIIRDRADKPFVANAVTTKVPTTIIRLNLDLGIPFSVKRSSENPASIFLMSNFRQKAVQRWNSLQHINSYLQGYRRGKVIQ